MGEYLYQWPEEGLAHQEMAGIGDWYVFKI